jgi:hypothetical protein
MSQRRKKGQIWKGTRRCSRSTRQMLKKAAAQPQWSLGVHPIARNAITSQYVGFAVEDLYPPSTTGTRGWRIDPIAFPQKGAFRLCYLRAKVPPDLAPVGSSKETADPSAPLPPDFLSSFVALANFMRLSLRKAAHEATGSAAQ